MTDHPLDTEALRRAARRVISDPYGGALETWWASHALRALDALAAAEHRATRAEAQSAIRGRAVVIYRERAREAEASRDEWRQTALDERGAALDLLEQIKARDARIRHLEDTARVLVKKALKAEAERDSARGYISELETAVQSRNDVIKHRDARIKAVQDLIDQADTAGDWTVTCSRLQWAIDGTNPYRASETA